MEKETLESYLKSGLSLNAIAKKTKQSLSTIRYWSRKHKLKSEFTTFRNQGKKEYGECRLCPRCKNQVATNDFYSRRGIKNASTYCKSCTNLQTVERQREFKSKCIEYKGGKCQSKNCSTPGGYSRCPGGLEFHHLDPKQKDFCISKMKNHRFNDVVKKELDKCSMLCSCCHREAHEVQYCR